LKRKHVTLLIIWDEYIAANPGGYSYSRFCQLYLAFKSKLAPTMSCRPNSRNGYGRKAVLTETGKIELEVPRDRLSTFDPQLIAKYQRRFPGFDEKIVSMYARGMSVRHLCLTGSGDASYWTSVPGSNPDCEIVAIQHPTRYQDHGDGNKDV